jgi:uncharacterized protein
MKFKVLFTVLLLLGVVCIFAANEFPKPTGWVNDYAGVMSEQTKGELTNWFTELKEKTDVEFAIAVFPNIGGKDYSNYATDLFREWGVGNKKDEGILLLVAIEERKIKFEVGYGSEEYLTDSYTAKAFRTMTALLPKGGENYDEAIKQASIMVLARISQFKGVQLTGFPGYVSQSNDYNNQKKTSSIFVLIVFIFLVIVTRGRILYWLLLFSVMGGGRSGRGGSGGFGGGGFGGFGGFGGGRSGGGGAGGGF